MMVVCFLSQSTYLHSNILRSRCFVLICARCHFSPVCMWQLAESIIIISKIRVNMILICNFSHLTNHHFLSSPPQNRSPRNKNKPKSICHHQELCRITEVEYWWSWNNNFILNVANTGFLSFLQSLWQKTTSLFPLSDVLSQAVEREGYFAAHVIVVFTLKSQLHYWNLVTPCKSNQT